MAYEAIRLADGGYLWYLRYHAVSVASTSEVIFRNTSITTSYSTITNTCEVMEVLPGLQ